MGKTKYIQYSHFNIYSFHWQPYYSKYKLDSEISNEICSVFLTLTFLYHIYSNPAPPWTPGVFTLDIITWIPPRAQILFYYPQSSESDERDMWAPSKKVRFKSLFLKADSPSLKTWSVDCSRCTAGRWHVLSCCRKSRQLLRFDPWSPSQKWWILCLHHRNTEYLVFIT